MVQPASRRQQKKRSWATQKPIENLAFQAFHERWSKQPDIWSLLQTPSYDGISFAHRNSPSHTNTYGFRMNIYIIYKDRRWSLTASWPDALRKSMHPWDCSCAGFSTKRGALFSVLIYHVFNSMGLIHWINHAWIRESAGFLSNNHTAA